MGAAVKPSLVLESGGRYPLSETVTRIGRSPDNEIVLEGPEAATVSLRHCEIVRDGDGFLVRDAGSTNGTYVDGERVTETSLSPGATIQLGSTGPRFTFTVTEEAPSLNATVMIPREAAEELHGTYDGLLRDAVTRARRQRSRGAANQTMMIMRETLQHALQRSGRRSRKIIGVLAVLLVTVSGLAAWKIYDLRGEKAAIDRRIEEIESRLSAAESGAEADELIRQLGAFEGEAAQLQQRLLFRFAAPGEDLVTGEIRTLMASFGAEVYSVPPEFTERVKHHIERYTGPDRPLVVHALAEGKRDLDTVRKLLQEEQLPVDLAYIPVVESALDGTQSSAAGAAGPWQFTPGTARAYGLRVDADHDERLNLVKSTRASCRYLRELILDFGAGSSLMLALAAYNVGPTRVKQAVMKNVRDPIKQRNFWYLYRVRALPHETREYVPKVVAVMILGRNPEKFGLR